MVYPVVRLYSIFRERRKEKTVDLSVLVDLTRDRRLRLSPKRWIKETAIWVKKLWREMRFLALWEIQSRFSTLTTFILVATVGWWTLPIMLIWALTATLVYEWLLSKGQPDLMEMGKPGFTGWIVGLLAFIFVGWRQVLYTHSVTRYGLNPGESRVKGLIRKILLGIGLVLFGVVPTHHLLKKAGYSKREIVWGNLAGRFLNVAFQILEMKFLLFVTAPIWPMVGRLIVQIWSMVGKLICPYW